jgi:hypothetical protein
MGLRGRGETGFLWTGIVVGKGCSGTSLNTVLDSCYDASRRAKFNVCY